MQQITSFAPTNNPEAAQYPHNLGIAQPAATTMLYYVHQTLFFPRPHTKERKVSGYARLTLGTSLGDKSPPGVRWGVTLIGA